MKTFVITVPYTATFTINNTAEMVIEEEDILDYFEVDSLDEISKEDLAEHFRSEAEELDISRRQLAEQFAEEVANNRSDFQVQVDDIEVEARELEADTMPVFWNIK
jgi:hypothetical protein